MKWLPDVWVHSNVCGKCAENEQEQKKVFKRIRCNMNTMLVKDSTDITATGGEKKKPTEQKQR